MRISRREFVYGMAGIAAVTMTAAGAIHERRVYAPGSALPPAKILRRNGIHPVSVERTPRGTSYLFPFDSLEARAKAWDRFNTDEDWRVIRDAGRVDLTEIRIYPGGKIFEMSL